MQAIFPDTADRLREWQAQPEVLGVVLVGSKSRGHSDGLSDDDLEVLLTDDAAAQRAPVDCLEVRITPNGHRLIYDTQYLAISALVRKAASPHDLDHWPYERAQVLFDRDGRVQAAVDAAARMDADFRQRRLLHATIDTWIASRRAEKTLQRGFLGAGRLIVARGAKALARLIFALEWRWVPLDHWLEAELRTLDDPTRAGEALVTALTSGSPAPIAEALERLEDQLAAEGVPRATERRDLFLELIHPSRAQERTIHGLY